MNQLKLVATADRLPLVDTIFLMLRFAIFLLSFLFSAGLLAQVDDITERTLTKTSRILPHPPVHERDLLWEKRTWEIIDARQKLNQVFLYPEEPFFLILQQAIEEGQVQAYDSDRFQTALTEAEFGDKIFRLDTIEVFNVNTYVPELKVIRDEINIEEVVRYRLSELWYFDSRTSQLRVRILGIAPLKSEYDEHGNFLYELPMFWVPYADLREVLARREVFVEGNDGARYTWDDLFEQRRFTGTVYQESNIRGERIQDYRSGRDALLTAEAIRQEIFNWEQDRWSY